MCAYSKEHEESRRLLVRAIASAKANEIKAAKRMLEKILRLPSTYEQISEAHYWLSAISEDSENKRQHLELALGYNPAHHLARKNLAIIDGKLDESKIIDPDTVFIQDSGKPIQSKGERYTCKKCGGNLTYSPDGSHLVCEYCESLLHFTSTGRVNETDFVAGISTEAGHMKAEVMQSFECTACGAVYLISPEVLSISCAHCDSTYSIQKTEASELIPPEGIIPFSITRDELENILIQWLQNNRVLKPPHIETLTGIYLPVWSFDISGLVKWAGEISQHEMYFPSTGQKNISFDDILVPACIQQPYKFMEILLGFDTKGVLPYSPKYTTNWLAQTYTVIMSDAAIEARSQAFHLAKQIIINEDEIRDVFDIKFSSAELFIEAFKLILVPVWIGVYMFSGKRYNFTINGMSGDLRGELPPTRLQRFSKWLLK